MLPAVKIGRILIMFRKKLLMLKQQRRKCECIDIGNRYVVGLEARLEGC